MSVTVVRWAAAMISTAFLAAFVFTQNAAAQLKSEPKHIDPTKAADRLQVIPLAIGGFLLLCIGVVALALVLRRKREDAVVTMFFGMLAGIFLFGVAVVVGLALGGADIAAGR